jgi:hypothetical protein
MLYFVEGKNTEEFCTLLIVWRGEITKMSYLLHFMGGEELTKTKPCARNYL